MSPLTRQPTKPTIVLGIITCLENMRKSSRSRQSKAAQVIPWVLQVSLSLRFICLMVIRSIILLSYFMWSGALDSTGFHQPYSIVALA